MACGFFCHGRVGARGPAGSADGNAHSLCGASAAVERCMEAERLLESVADDLHHGAAVPVDGVLYGACCEAPLTAVWLGRSDMDCCSVF